MTNLRYLRLTYKIPLSEIACILGTSNQHISRVEFEPSQRIQENCSHYAQAIETLIQVRREQLNTLECDFNQVKDVLFQESQEDAP